MTKIIEVIKTFVLKHLTVVILSGVIVVLFAIILIRGC
jgi:hypothetical protein